MKNLCLEIKNLIINVLDLEDTTVDDIDDDAPLFEQSGIGLDSIDALEIGVALHKKYKLHVDANADGNRENFYSVRTLASYVKKQLELN